MNTITDKLSYGFQWVNVDATISVDLTLSDSDTAKFLEFLFFMWVQFLDIFTILLDIVMFTFKDEHYHR